VLADLGLRATAEGGPLPARLAVVDHHVPRGAPEGATLIHGHGLEPTPTSSLLAWWCAQGLLGEEEADALLWLAAVGLIGDLGDRAPFEELGAAKARHGAGRLRELATLVNAPRRAGTADARPALDLLLRAEDPRDALEGGHPEREACQAAREEVNAALARGRRQPPRFGGTYGGEVAIVRVDSPCQIHPLVAQSWVRRLRGQIVFAANFGFLPGHVSFAGRGREGADILDFLARHRPEGADPVLYGNGHARASGGTLPHDAWNALMADLGFGPELRA
jgi:single-stranded-DNA-specific exonuclease